MSERMRQFYAEQLEYLKAGDARQLVEAHYQPDASLVTVERVTTGRDSLIALFEGYIKQIGSFEVRTDKFQATDNTVLIEATLTSQLGVSRIYDVFVLRDGKISYHFAGVM